MQSRALTSIDQSAPPSRSEGVLVHHGGRHRRGPYLSPHDLADHDDAQLGEVNEWRLRDTVKGSDARTCRTMARSSSMLSGSMGKMQLLSPPAASTLTSIALSHEIHVCAGRGAHTARS
jgi:hypothetical protein